MSGTVTPPVMASISSDFKYRNFGLSFMFMMYAGSVMRDVFMPMITYPQNYISGANLNRDMNNYWQSPEDSNNPDVFPAIYRNASSNTTYLWAAADRHILNSGYVKLRNVTFSYTLPEKMLKSMSMEDLTLSLQVENPLIIGFNGKGLNPESWSGSSLNPSRGTLTTPTFSLGLNIRF